MRLTAALDWEHGGSRLRDFADRLGRTEAAVRQRASRLRTTQLESQAPPRDLCGIAGFETAAYTTAPWSRPW